jgi:hypothetical protein
VARVHTDQKAQLLRALAGSGIDVVDFEVEQVNPEG